MSAKEYRSDSITDGTNVTFAAGRCIHSREYIHGLPGVFDAEKRPWLQFDKSASQRVGEVVMRCPTGALQSGTSETLPPTVAVKSLSAAAGTPGASLSATAPAAE